MSCTPNDKLVADETISVNHESYFEISTVNYEIFERITNQFPTLTYTYLESTGEYVFVLDKAQNTQVLNFITSINL